MIKKLLFILICFLCVTSIYADTWTNSLKSKGKQETFVASENGKATCVIVVPVKADAKDTRAAEELQKWFKEICNISFPIVKEDKMPKDKKIISIGNTSLAKNTNLGVLSQNIKPEGYAIIEKGDNLFLLGGTRRGPMFAVFALLEEDLGVRWYTKKGETKIPKAEDLIIKYVPRQFNPSFDTRFPGLEETYSNADFNLRNRMNPWFGARIPEELGGNTFSWNVCHSSFAMLSPDEYFKDHPEYFSMINGKRVPKQLCYSNPEVIKILTEKTKELLKQDDYKYIAISPQDGEPLCDCDKCNALDKPEGTKAATLITALNKICDNIKDEYPDKRIITLAYLDYYTPPKTIVPNKNITVLVCSDSHDWNFPFCRFDETDKFSKGLKRWIDMGADTLSWFYVTNYEHTVMPNPNMLLVGENIKELQKAKVGGVFLQSDTWGTGSDSSAMRAWVWGKKLWNPDLNTKSLMKDFVYGYYKESAEPIWKYQELLLSIWEKNHKKPHNVRTKPYTPNSKNPLMVWDIGGIRWNPTASMYSKDFVKKSMEYMDEALKNAKSVETIERVKLMRVQMLYLVLSQGIGYFSSAGDFYISKEMKNKDTTNTLYYAKLLDEFEDTCKTANIQSTAEIYDYKDVPVRITKWRTVLKMEAPIFPIVATNSKWGFITDKDNSGEQKGYTNPDFDDSSWKKIETSKTWEAQGFADYDGCGWYKTTENITSDMLSKPYVWMYFGAVDEEAWVYINGKLAYERSVAITKKPTSEIWSKPFIFDAKPFLKEGKNQITVRVMDAGFAGGIFRDVYFIPYDKILDPLEVKNAIF